MMELFNCQLKNAEKLKDFYEKSRAMTSNPVPFAVANI